MCDENYTYDVIRNKSDEIKVDFITNAIAQTGIPAHFKPLSRFDENKIFFRGKNGEQTQREWLLFENNSFFCVYCLCYSLYERHRLISGIDFVKNCKITELLNKHENEAHHVRAKNIYVEKISNCDPQEKTNRSEKRIVLTTIIKIIIFQATHG